MRAIRDVALVLSSGHESSVVQEVEPDEMEVVNGGRGKQSSILPTMFLR
jgi:hypothetical protein